MHRPSRIHARRTGQVSAAVVLAHVGVAWLVSSGLGPRVVPANEPDNVIMASVTMEAPTPQSPPLKSRAPTVQQHNKPPPQAVSQPLHPTPGLPPTAPGDAAPTVPAAPLAPPTPATALATGHQRPAPQATAVAVVLPSSNADYLNNPTPPYPRLSKRMGEEGTVVIRVLITPEGHAEKAEIRSTSGHARLDDAALTTVKNWRFVPGKRNGVPEAMWFNVPIRFVLD